MINKNLLEIIVCPVCLNKLKFKKEKSEIICEIDQLIYPIYKNIPILIKEKAKKIK